MPTLNETLKEAMALRPAERAELISSLDQPDRELDEFWAKEAESRIDACERGKMRAVALEKVLERYG